MLWYPESLLSDQVNVPPEMHGWLTDAGSLVSRLRAHGVLPAVTVLGQYIDRPFADEASLLAIPPGQDALIREVLIGEPERPFVFARTIFPTHILTGSLQVLGELGTRSLGSVLFENPLLQRGQFEIGMLSPDLAWHASINRHCELGDHYLWARRSVFSIKHKSLLVNEVFLPAIRELMA